MLIQTLTEEENSEEERKRYKIVRLDMVQDVPGFIIRASTHTGLCKLRLSDGSEPEYNFGPNCLAIIPK